MTSIPYEKGWSAYVDGKKVEVDSIKDAFCTIDLKKGTHEIEFRYIPYGFIVGNIITILSIALLIALYYVDKTYKKRKQLIAEIEATDFSDVIVDYTQESENVQEKTIEEFIKNTFPENEE